MTLTKKIWQRLDERIKHAGIGATPIKGASSKAVLAVLRRDVVLCGITRGRRNSAFRPSPSRKLHSAISSVQHAKPPARRKEFSVSKTTRSVNRVRPLDMTDTRRGIAATPNRNAFLRSSTQVFLGRRRPSLSKSIRRSLVAGRTTAKSPNLRAEGR